MHRFHHVVVKVHQRKCIGQRRCDALVESNFVFDEGLVSLLT